MKNLKTSMTIFATVLMLNSCLSRLKENEVRTYEYWSDGYSKYFPHGSIVTVNNDTLNGIINIIESVSRSHTRTLSKIQLLPEGKTSIVNDIITFDKQNLQNIRSLRLINHLAPKGYMNYVYLSNSKKWDGILWIIVKQKGTASIYSANGLEGTPYDFKNLYKKAILLLAKSDSIIPIQSGFPAKGAQGSKKRVLKFINKRYNQQFKLSDFKNEDAMIDYILDKEVENEKEINKTSN